MPGSTELQSAAQKVRSGPAWPRILQGLGYMALWSALLFVSAGTVHWLRGWIGAGALITTMLLMGLVVHRHNPQLFAERARWHRPDTKRFDVVILSVYLLLMLAQPALAGLDAVRFRWSGMPFRAVQPGAGLLLLGMATMGWALWSNPWAESSVRIQRDRGQQVVRWGAYRWVRHPMYAGSLLVYVGVAMVLGSWWALGIAAVMDGLIVVRTVLEDRILHSELAGYAEYAAVTRFRLVPGVW